MDQETTIEVTYDQRKVQGSKREQVLLYVANLKAKGTTSIYQIRMGTLNSLMGGIMTVTQHAGTLVSGAQQTIAAGFELNRIYTLGGQNADGSAPTISSIASGGTALVAGEDYVVAKAADGLYGIMIISNAKASAGTDVDVTYSYTPAAYTKATMGSSIASISKKVVRFSKSQAGKKFQVTLYSAAMTNGLKLSFPGADSENPPSVPVELEGDLDETRADGDQLLEIIDEIGIE
jgi:hypothetical protein